MVLARGWGQGREGGPHPGLRLYISVIAQFHRGTARKRMGAAWW